MKRASMIAGSVFAVLGSLVTSTYTSKLGPAILSLPEQARSVASATLAAVYDSVGFLPAPV